MNRLIESAGRKAIKAGYKDIFEKHIKLTSADDDYEFFLKYGTFQKLKKEYGQRAEEYKEIIRNSKLSERPIRDCGSCLCIGCDNQECMMSLCAGVPGDCPEIQQRKEMAKCWRDECEHFEREV